MKKHIAATIATIALIACGAPIDGEPETVATAAETQDEFELGELEQQLTSNQSKFGITTAASHQTCRSDGSSGQDCLVPAQKNIVYCYSNAGGSWTSTEINTVEAFGVNSIAGKLPTWSFSRLMVDQSSCASDGTVNKIRKGTCSGGSSGANIENFVCYSPTVFGSYLTESLPGNWRRMRGGLITVDFADINTKAHPNCVLGHGIAHWLLAAAGIGHDSSVSDPFGVLISSRAIEPMVYGAPPIIPNSCVHSQVTDQEECFAASATDVGTNSMSFRSSACN